MSDSCWALGVVLSALLQNIRRSIRRYNLLPQGSAVVIGLSGGSDSVALTLILRELARHGGSASPRLLI